MATKVYDTAYINTISGEEIYITPLKIKHLRPFMDSFTRVYSANGDAEILSVLSESALIAMRQYSPSIKTIEDFEDNFDISTLYKIIEIASGIKLQSEPDSDAKKPNSSEETWDTLDLLKLESEAFLLGIWKDYDDLESSLSMPELINIIEAKRENDYADKKFFAAIQGVDLDKQSGKKDAWEEMKARVFSGNQAKDANDILALQGSNAQKAGFGIGMGLSYEKID